MTEKEITDLLKRYTNQQCTKDEIIFVESWYNSLDYKHPIQVNEFESIKHQTWHLLDPQRRKKRNIYQYAAMLIGILLLSTAAYFIVQNHKEDLSHSPIAMQPVSYQAMLIIGSKDSIDLNSLQIGETKNANGINVKKLENGMISYEVQTDSKSMSEWNKLIVPRGGQYKIKLADNSLVVVNSESELQFPSRFTGNERRIKMVGEGYFEVTKNSYKPFIINSKDQEVTVLGTKFNIQAYRNENNITTTLLEGKVKVSSPKGDIVLLPGDQTVYNGENMMVSKAKTSSVTTWKDDIFLFEGEPLGKIMQQMSRWYNIEVKFDTKDIARMRFTGSISKYQTIDQALHLLEITGKVKFRIDNQTIYVKAN
jgi:hypothetical protein